MDYITTHPWIVGVIWHSNNLLVTVGNLTLFMAWSK